MPSETPEQPSGSGADPSGLPDELNENSAVPANLDYEVIRLIARGGYGEVWLVKDNAGTYRACKVVYRESFDNERPYEREYAGIKKFEPVSRANQSQVHVLHVGRRDAAGYFYYIMELADDVNRGPEIDPERYVPKTLKIEMARRGPLPVSECIHIGLALSATLENLHRHGLIHRDVKPANIIFVNGVPKLADIGLVTDADVSISYVGTDGYIPPEGPTSPQADVYGLGKVLYEISTGRDRQDFPLLPEDFTQLPERPARLEFNAVVMRACQSDPKRRYQSAREVHSDLALLQSGRSVRRRQLVRKRIALGARLGLVLLVFVALAIGFQFRRNSPQMASSSPNGKVLTQRLALPEAAQVASKETEIRRSYQEQPGKLDAKARIASELLLRSATAQEPARELASLRVAATLALEAQDFDLALQACARMGERFQLDPLPVKSELLHRGSRADLSAAASARLAEACIATGFEALAQDDYERGNELADLARAVTHDSANPHLAKQIEWLAGETTRCRTAYGQVSRFFEVLRQDPSAPEANLRVGEFLCFAKNDWQTGLPLMAHGNDGGLRTVLEKELAQKSLKRPETVTLGNLWWELAASATNESRVNFQRRARYWYLKGIAQARGQEKTRLRDQLAERIQTTRSWAGEVHIFSRVNGVEHITLFSDEVRWLSMGGSIKDRINDVPIGDLKPRDTRVIKNCGTTRLYPEDLDFRTAQLTINHKGKRRGRASLEAAEDHVRIDLADQPMGMSDLEVTITFGQP